MNIQLKNDVRYLVLLDTIYVNLPANMLFNIQTVRDFVTIISIHDEELLSEATGIQSHAYIES